MPKVNHLSNVQPGVLALCKQGANRQRIFLKKEQETQDRVGLPGGQRLLRKADEGTDWSYFYCVVAEPDATEDPGIGDGRGSGIDDMWASADEIRKAAHYFAKSNPLVTGMHDTIEPYGAVVENAIALADFDVLAPDGTMQTIRKGSWYVGIEPTPEGKLAIDAGEFTGISLEGTGERTLVELAKQDGADAEKRGVLKKVAEYLGLSLPTETGTLSTGTSEEDEDVDEKKITELDAKVETIAKAQGAATTAIEGLIGTVNKLVERIDNGSSKEGDEKPTPEKLQKAVEGLAKSFGDFAEKLDGIEADVSALAEGDSTQHNDDTIRKSKGDNPLVGILD